MNSETKGSHLFAHSRLDMIPVLGAAAHLAFDIYLIVGFASRPIWISAVLGCIYSVSISWNINGVSHNFIHTPYFNPGWMHVLAQGLLWFAAPLLSAGEMLKKSA
jgi:hypothetical protein